MVIGGPSWRPAFSSGEASWPLDFRIPESLEKSDFSARENSSFFGKPYAVLLGNRFHNNTRILLDRHFGVVQESATRVFYSPTHLAFFRKEN